MPDLVVTLGRLTDCGIVVQGHEDGSDLHHFADPLQEMLRDTKITDPNAGSFFSNKIIMKNLTHNLGV